MDELLPLAAFGAVLAILGAVSNRLEPVDARESTRVTGSQIQQMELDELGDLEKRVKSARKSFAFLAAFTGFVFAVAMVYAVPILADTSFDAAFSSVRALFLITSIGWGAITIQYLKWLKGAHVVALAVSKRVASRQSRI